MSDELKTGIASGIDWCFKHKIEVPLDIVIGAIQAGAFKSYDYFLENLTRLIRSVYESNLGGDFVGIVGDLIRGQISDAYEQAWVDDGNELPPPDYLQEAAHQMIDDQGRWVDNLYKDIVDARVDQTSADAVLNRAALWANRWNEAYADGKQLIALENGQKMVWEYGDTDHCDTCASLNGIVAYAKEWETSRFRPQNAPNPLLNCGGWRCGCTLTVTDARRSPKALDHLLNLGTGRAV